MRAQLESAASKTGKIEAEKTKLMEAIVALEEERGRGGIDAKVYADLNSSYRKELAEIWRWLEEEGG